MSAAEPDALGLAVIEHLGPAALAGGTMTILEAFEKGWHARAATPALIGLELNEHTREILGRPNFTCIRIANRLREMGHQIPTKAEEEQAATIYFLLGHYLEHGASWAEHADAALNRRGPPATAAEGTTP